MSQRGVAIAVRKESSGAREREELLTLARGDAAKVLLLRDARADDWSRNVKAAQAIPKDAAGCMQGSVRRFCLQ